MLPTTYSTRNDLIEHEIIPALGNHAADYDAESLSYDVASFDPATQKFEITATPAEFYRLAAHHLKK